MKIFILTEGGKDIGFGHVSRCLSLCQAFEDKGLPPKLIINCDENIEGLLKGRDYQAFNWLKQKEKALGYLKGADIIVLDSYLADLEFYRKISEISPVSVYLDDYKRIDYPEGVVVNPSIYGQNFDYARESGSVLSGIDYVIMRKDFWNVPDKIINKNVKDILITFGITAPAQMPEKIVSCLGKEFNFTVVDPRKNALGAEQMLSLMLKADICISAGGQTVYELARVGVPAIGICFAENQRKNLEAWDKEGFLEYIGWYNDDSLSEKLEKALNKLLPYGERAKRSIIGNRLCDYAQGFLERA